MEDNKKFDLISTFKAALSPNTVEHLRIYNEIARYKENSKYLELLISIIEDSSEEQRLKLLALLQIRDVLVEEIQLMQQNKRKLSDSQIDNLMNFTLDEVENLLRKEKESIEALDSIPDKYNVQYSNALSLVIFYISTEFEAGKEKYLDYFFQIITDFTSDSKFLIQSNSFILSFLTVFIEENENFLIFYFKKAPLVVENILECIIKTVERRIFGLKSQTNSVSTRMDKFSRKSKKERDMSDEKSKKVKDRENDDKTTQSGNNSNFPGTVNDTINSSTENETKLQDKYRAYKKYQDKLQDKLQEKIEETYTNLSKTKYMHIKSEFSETKLVFVILNPLAINKYIFVFERLTLSLEINNKILNPIYQINKSILLSLSSANQEMEINFNADNTTKKTKKLLVNFAKKQLNENCLKLNLKILMLNNGIFVTDIDFLLIDVFLNSFAEDDYNTKLTVLDTISLFYDYYFNLNKTLYDQYQGLVQMQDKGNKGSFYGGCYSKTNYNQIVQQKKLEEYNLTKHLLSLTTGNIVRVVSK